MKFLIIRFSSIGDIVLTTPAIRCLKQQVPNAEVHYLTKKNFRPIIASNPYVDKLVLLNSDWDAMIHELQQEGYDYIIDLHHNIRTWRIKKALKHVPSFSFNKLNFRKWVLTTFKINTLPKLHIVDRYLGTLATFNVVNDGRGLDYFLPEHENISLKDIPMPHQMGYIGVVIGAALNTKKMPIEKLRDLCNKIQYPLILLGGNEDVEAGNTIASIDPVKIYNACGKFSLNESAGLVQRAKLIITHDTGLMHIAAAFQKPIISIWGNTAPAFGMDAYYGNNPLQDIKFEVKKLWCRPCSKIGYKKCPLGHFKCMQKHSVENIKNTVSTLLNSAK